MSLTNAISAISVVAAIEIAGRHETTLRRSWDGGGGAGVCQRGGRFMITDRMLKMFKKR